MALNVYNVTNLAVSSIVSGISASSNTLVLNGKGDLFPVSNFWIKVEQLDNTSTNEIKPVTKREIMKVTNRSGDTFSIERGAGYCPASDTADTQTNTPLAFDAGAIVTHIDPAEFMEETQTAIQALETDKLDISDYISGSKLFKDSTTGTDAYQIDIPEVTSYAQIDGQTIRVRVDVENTADATLEINTLGAKPITKYQGNPLQTGDILAGQIIEVVWDNTDDEWEIKNTIDQSKNVETDKFVVDVTLGEDIQAGDGLGAVFYGRGFIETEKVFINTTNSDLELGKDGNPYKLGMVINVPDEKVSSIKSIQLGIRKVGNPTDNIIFTLYESDRTTEVVGAIKPAVRGSTLGTVYQQVSIELGNPTVIPGTQYFLEIARDGGQDLSNYYEFKVDTSITSTDIVYSINDGATRTDSTHPFTVELIYSFLYEEGKVWSSDDTYDGTCMSDGIILQSGLEGDVVSMQIGGILVQNYVDNGRDYWINTDKVTYYQDIANAVNIYSQTLGSGSGVYNEAFYSPYMSIDGIYFFMNKGNGRIDKYRLIKPYDLSDKVLQQSIGISGSGRGIYFSDDGINLYCIGNTGAVITQHILGDAFDISNIIQTKTYDMSSYQSKAYGVKLSDDGQILLVTDNGNNVHRYNLLTPFDLDTISHDSSYDTSSNSTTLVGVDMNSDGTRLFVYDTGFHLIQYSMSTPFNITTSTYDLTKNVGGGSSDIGLGMRISHNGFYIYTTEGRWTQYLYNYECKSELHTKTLGAYSILQSPTSNIQYRIGKGKTDNTIMLFTDISDFNNTEDRMQGGLVYTLYNIGASFSPPNYVKVLATLKIGKTISVEGTYITGERTISFTYHYDGYYGNSYADIWVYVNGVSVGNKHRSGSAAKNGDTYINFICNEGDIVELKGRKYSSNDQFTISNVKLQCDIGFISIDTTYAL